MSQPSDSDANQSLIVAEMLPLPPALFAYSSNTIKSEYEHISNDDGDRHKNAKSRYKKLRDEGQLCDVTFLAGANKTRIEAHKLILAGASDYFATMFTSQLKEAQEREISMENVRGDVLKAIVNCCYTGSILIKEDNVQALYRCAHLMQLNDIVKGCSQFLIKVLHPSNCVQIQLFAKLMSDTDLLEQATSYLQKHFHEVIEQEEILHINLDQLIALFDRDHLKIERESYRLSAVKKWVDHNPSDRRIHIISLIPLVNFALLETELSVNELEDFLPDYLPIYKTIIVDLLKSRLLASKKSTELDRVLVLGDNGSESDSDWSNLFIDCYDPESNSWSRSHSMYDQRKYFEAAVLNENLYVIGGYVNGRKSKEMLCLNLRTDVWSPSVPMNVGRCNFAVAVLDGFIYVMGDHGDTRLTSVERWKPTTTKWEYVAPLRNQHGYCIAAVCSGMLYASTCGGNAGVLFECYNPRKNRWTQCAPMPTDVKIQCAVGTSKDLYALSIRKENDFRPVWIGKYDPASNRWTQLLQFENNESISAACLIGERILIVNDNDNDTNDYERNAVKLYDTNSNTLTNLTFLPQQKCNVCLVSVPAELTECL